MIFKTKKDFQICGPLYGIVLLSWILYGLTTYNRSFDPSTFIISCVITALILLALFGTYYKIQGDCLLVCCCFITRKIYISRISSIKKLTKNDKKNKKEKYITPNIALSLDRIEIFTDNYFKEVSISPKNISLFIAELKKINPAIEEN